MKKIENRKFRISERNLQRWICMILAVCSAFLLTGSVLERRSLSVEAKVSALQEDLAGEVLRFHVVANSDSQKDQVVKYQVRDAVIDQMRQWLGQGEETTLEETKVPFPRRTSSTPWTVRSRIASRRVARLTPSWRESSTSLGSLSPGFSWPSTTIWL